MRSKLAITMGGLALTVTLGLPAGAQAAVSHPAPVPATTAALGVPVSVSARAATVRQHSTAGVDDCDWIWEEGTGKYALTVLDSYTNLALGFEPLSYFGGNGLPEFCNDSVPDVNGAFEIQDVATGLCLFPDSQYGEILEGTCGDQYSVENWFATKVSTYHSWSVYVLHNETGVCLYDDLQWPATYTSCNPSDDRDEFEWFVWPGLP
jgi:hypothetical protein